MSVRSVGPHSLTPAPSADRCKEAGPCAPTPPNTLMHRTVVKSFAALASASLHGGIGRPGGGAGDRNAGGAFGLWRLGRCLHTQGGTDVYEAFPRHGEQHQARYVLKRLRDVAPDRAAVAALRREAGAAREVRSPHVVAVLEARVDAPPYYLVMPRLSGRTLAERCAAEPTSLPAASRAPPSIAGALGIARQVASGLAALHAAGRMHGDVKPSNLIIAPDGHVTLIDLGFARRIDDPADAEDCFVLGTVDYLAPEAVCSRLRSDVRSDLYSLGVVLFEMLAGRRPFLGATTAAVVQAHACEPPPRLRELNSSIPNDVAEVVASLLAKTPLRRPQSATEVVERLARLEIRHFDLR